MRVFGLVVTFGLLVLLLGAMWAHRFERMEGRAVWRMEDLRAADVGWAGVKWQKGADGWVMRVSLSEERAHTVIRVALPWGGLEERVHVRIRLKADHLKPGKEIWEDGRVILEWHAPSGQVENDGVASAQGEFSYNEGGMVIASEAGSAVPVLRIEHLGRSGSFEISGLEMTVVQECALWKVGKWLMAFAWVAWVAMSLGGRKVAAWRRFTAGAVWVLVATQFVVPGPWKNQKPLFFPLQLGEATEVQAAKPRLEPAMKESGIPSADGAGRVEPLGKLPDRGSLILRIKQRVTQARPLLHALLLFAPVCVLAFLVGKRPALLLGGLLAVLIEFAQFAFGYGFDFTDVGDLACDAVGIFGALWCWGWYQKTVRRGGFLASQH